MKGWAVIYARTLAALGVVVALGACAPEPASSPLVMVTPGQGKDAAAFQQDDLICRHHAAAHTGYSQAPPTASGPGATNGNAPPSATSPDVVPADEIGYVQCMAARGDTVQPESQPYAGAVDPYGVGFPYAYGYPYPYGFGYPYPFYDGGFFADFGFGGGYRGRYHGGWGHGFANSGYGHGGYGHGGFGHSGFGHGGGGHGGGGGHR